MPDKLKVTTVISALKNPEIKWTRINPLGHGVFWLHIDKMAFKWRLVVSCDYRHVHLVHLPSIRNPEQGQVETFTPKQSKAVLDACKTAVANISHRRDEDER